MIFVTILVMLLLSSSLMMESPVFLFFICSSHCEGCLSHLFIMDREIQLGISHSLKLGIPGGSCHQHVPVTGLKLVLGLGCV